MGQINSAQEFLEVALYAALAGLMIAAFNAYVLPRL